MSHARVSREMMGLDKHLGNITLMGMWNLDWKAAILEV